ncbi:FHA domain-containing protein [Trichlorobacter ammonificans]|uniref:FHA domain containing protein n=1 Tax=Trichlorobacter ammonificans TaxID=2916410 RepID=A0ABN8HGX0_9BACT|nr:FHA domain-containing protein [Trichlorobacter ammonificans]CAH2030845.1 FHA domain containing protein [Trichlorobacter ammonificans]
MPALILPSGTTLVNAIPFKRETMAEILRRLAGAGSPFTGYCSLNGSDTTRLLFLFQSQPYAAALITGTLPTPLSITEFCAQAALLPEGSTSLSLHAADPVLLKCLLVLVQAEPAPKTPVGMSDLERIQQQIHREGGDVLVILERGGFCNVFFYKDGDKTVAYWADSGAVQNPDMTIDEQMLVYAVQPASHAVNAIIHRDLATAEAPDAAAMSLEGMVRLFSADIGTLVPETASPLPAEQHAITLQVIAGPQSGSTIRSAIPCVLGRRDTDTLINDPMVSKRHAALQLLNGRLVLMDLHSTNGTTLNGQPVVTPQEVATGDRIGLGQTVLTVDTITLS